MRSAKTVVGNWKMHGLKAALAEVSAIAAGLADAHAVEVAVCPPSTLLAASAEAARGTPLRIGAQDVSDLACGAHTGDLAAAMLADAGAAIVIVGHSERRRDHGETDALVARKARAALAAGLRPIICVGEGLEEHDRGAALEVVRRQLAGSVPEEARGAGFLLAYEPNWAIGTGRTPSPEDIASVHAAIRRATEPFGAPPILYGGSVTGKNAGELMAVEGVDGALVGGASLTAADFLPIVAAAARTAAGASLAPAASR